MGIGEGHRPLLDYLLYNAHTAGYRQVVLLVGEHDPSIRQYYEEGAGQELFPNLTISFVVQPIRAGRTKPLGTADALERVLDGTSQWRGQQLTVCNSDNLYSEKALRILLESGAANSMIAYDQAGLRVPAEHVTHWAVIQSDGDGYLRDIVEKPTFPAPQGFLGHLIARECSQEECRNEEAG